LTQKPIGLFPPFAFVFGLVVLAGFFTSTEVSANSVCPLVFADRDELRVGRRFLVMRDRQIGIGLKFRHAVDLAEGHGREFPLLPLRRDINEFARGGTPNTVRNFLNEIPIGCNIPTEDYFPAVVGNLLFHVPNTLANSAEHLGNDVDLLQHK
jgi:hypothetical protein